MKTPPLPSHSRSSTSYCDIELNQCIESILFFFELWKTQNREINQKIKESMQNAPKLPTTPKILPPPLASPQDRTNSWGKKRVSGFRTISAPTQSPKTQTQNSISLKTPSPNLLTFDSVFPKGVSKTHGKLCCFFP